MLIYPVFTSASTRRIRILVLIIPVLLSFNVPAFSKIRGPYRTRFETNIGYGFPESICLKLRYGDHVQAGLSQAFDTRGFGPTSMEIYYRIGKKPRLLDRSPWYLMGGLAGYLFDLSYDREYELLIYPRIGRSFHFTNQVGFNLDVGPGFTFNRSTRTNTIAPVVLTGSMSIFFRF
jgi:hypothetical protein